MEDILHVTCWYGSRSNQVFSLDDLQVNESCMCIGYANKHNLMKEQGWE